MGSDAAAARLNGVEAVGFIGLSSPGGDASRVFCENARGREDLHLALMTKALNLEFDKKVVNDLSLIPPRRIWSIDMTL